MYALWIWDLVDLLKLLWEGLRNWVRTDWHRLGGGSVRGKKREMRFFCLHIQTQVCVLEKTVCVSAHSFDIVVCSPLFSLFLSIFSHSLFLSHLHAFNVSLLIWRWLCLPWCTSPRQRGPRAGLALLCQQLRLPFFSFPSSCLQRDERNNKKKSQNQESQCAK